MSTAELNPFSSVSTATFMCQHGILCDVIGNERKAGCRVGEGVAPHSIQREGRPRKAAAVVNVL